MRQVARRTTKDILAKFDASMAPAADVHALIAAHAATLAPSDAGGVFGMLCVCEHLFLAVLLVIVSSYVWSRACMCVVGVGSSALRHAGQFGVLSDREPLLGQQGGEGFEGCVFLRGCGCSHVRCCLPRLNTQCLHQFGDVVCACCHWRAC